MNFTNCKIIGDGIDHDAYAKQPDGIKRGDVGWIMSRGELMTFAECPAKWIAGVENKDTKATDWGDLVDSMLLSPAKFEMKFAVAPKTYADGKDWTYKAKFCQEWREEKEAAGLTVTNDAEMKKATTALVALQKNKSLMELVECSKTQVMATSDYSDKGTGLTIGLKILLDLVPDKDHPRFGMSLSDFKTCQDASMFKFGRAINEHHYDAQQGLYTPIYVGATNERREDWRFALQESSEPYHSEIYTMSESFKFNGATKIQRALELYCWCLKNKLWPGYGAMSRNQYKGIGIIEAEDWMTTRLADFCRIPEMQSEQTKPETVDVLP